jgi:hypothetical protein
MLVAVSCHRYTDTASYHPVQPVALDSKRMCMGFLSVVVLGGLLGAFPQVACAQTYHLTSWEGHLLTVSVSYQLFSKRLAVSCAGDTLFLQNYQGTESVRVLRQRFLQITYTTRCGSDCRTQNTVLLSVRQHRLQVPLLVLSANEWESFSHAGARAHHYAVALTMPKSPAWQYTLQARVHDEYSAAQEPANTYTRDQLVTLRFDSMHQVFYSAWEPIARCLPVFGEETKKHFVPGDLFARPLVQPYVTGPNFPTVPLCVTGTFPTVRLTGQLYYFIRGKWYEGPAKHEANALYWFTTDAVQHASNRVK